MCKSAFNRHIFFYFFVLLITSVMPFSLFASWPIFISPDKQFLLDHGVIDTANCPAGYGKLKTAQPINIHQALCSTYCPDNWAWISNADEKCHDLNKEFEFQGYTITHYNSDNGTTLYSQVTAFYGIRDVNQPVFSYTFTSPQDNWYCVVMNPTLHTVTCANDVAVLRNPQHT